MSTQVGIYRGSFDPPHYGHLEVVSRCLESGMDSVVIVFKDRNRFKPFRSSDEVRKDLIERIFSGIARVTISEEPYKAIVSRLKNDSTVQKVHQIVSSDFFCFSSIRFNLSEKLSYFVIPREDHPLPLEINNTPYITILPSDQLKDQKYSSTQIRLFFKERRTDFDKLPLPLELAQYIHSQQLYQSSDAEYENRALLQEALKIVEQEIGAKELVPLDDYRS